jgi:site-specific DNA-methyltransferase (cytosine-N4-specific)
MAQRQATFTAYQSAPELEDYTRSLAALTRVLRPRAPAGIVVGNRTMSRVAIPLHLLTLDLLDQLGYTDHEVAPREVPSKTVPFENAPENVPGDVGQTMADEYVIAALSPGEVAP